MRIAEISTPDFRQGSAAGEADTSHYSHVLSQVEASINALEQHSASLPLPDSFSSELRRVLAELSQLAPFLNSTKLLLWKLSYRLWNTCVDLSNAASTANSSGVHRLSEEHAKLRQIAADLLYLTADVAGIPSPAFKAGLFFYKTGIIWHDLEKFDLANECFEKATDLISKVESNSISDNNERKLLLDLNLARSRTAWEVSDRNLSVALLNRSKKILFGASANYKALANQYLTFGKILLSNDDVSGVNEALKLMNEALELCEKGLRIVKKTEETLNLKELRLKILRFMAAAHLQSDEFESVLKCVKVLREGVSGGDHHPSLSVLAMKAWLGMRRYNEAEKELRGMVVNNGIPEGVWVSAVESYFQAVGAAGAETVKGVFLGLLGRCRVSAGIAIRVANRLVGDGAGGAEGAKLKAKVMTELVSDERVVELFSGDAAVKERIAMHALLWNCAAEHFRAKEYHISAEMFEKSLLYGPQNIENRIFRAKGFRVLCLCHLGLSQLDRAEEYINEAEKLEPNIASAFLKFKIYLQKKDHDSTIAQVQAMSSCLDFTPDFLSLAAHEAIACRSLPVATASLSHLLNFYSLGKSLPTNEVIVFRTLVTVLIQDSNSNSEILKHLKKAHERQAELGPKLFFGNGEVGRRERNWFAVNAWNLGVRNGKEKNYELCAEFFRLASEFYSIISDMEAQENDMMIGKSLVLAVSSILANERHKQATLMETEIKEAVELLDRARKILMSSSGSSTKVDGHIASMDPDFFFIYTWSAYDLYSRLSDMGAQQLILIKNLASSKSCNPQHLLQIGFDAAEGPRSNAEVATFALHTCLSSLLSSPTPNYQTVALVLRKLISVATIHKADNDDDSLIEIYRQAYRIMVGLKEGEYPLEEVKWLALTAWNRAALPVRLGHIDEAKKWMNLGLELVTKVPGMLTYKSCMEDYVAGFEKKVHGHDNGKSRSLAVS